MPSIKLDLGCGSTPLPGYVGVEKPSLTSCLEPDAHGIIYFDVASGMPWPFEDESVEGLYSSHLIEHLPAHDVLAHALVPRSYAEGNPHSRGYWPAGMQDALCWFMDEAWRVTNVGGEFRLRWPALTDERTGKLSLAAFVDPTHRRFIPTSQLHYFSREGRSLIGVPQYRIGCNWRVVELGQAELGTSGELIENRAVLVREP